MPKSVTRIISDVHYLDPASWVKDLAVLRPLLDGVTHLIVNGDAMDTQQLLQPQERVAEFKRFIGQHAPQLTCLTGNHDPDISDVHELWLAEGTVWLTHGDAFFEDICPWSRLLPEIHRRIRAETQGMNPAELRLLETRFRIFRKVCLNLPPDHDPHVKGLFAGIRKTASAIFPPHRVFSILKVWREMPGLVARTAAEQRPAAKIIINGHTHHRGVWRRPDGRVIVNTGAFSPPGGGLFVDLVDDAVIVREFERKRGECRPGPVIAQPHPGLLPHPNRLNPVS